METSSYTVLPDIVLHKQTLCLYGNNVRVKFMIGCNDFNY